MNAVVTGAASGLGRALCVEIAARGGRLIVADIDREGAEQTAAQLGTEAHVFTCDVGDRDQVFALAAHARQTLGEVDVLCNNAGVTVTGRFERIELPDWRWIMDVNLWGVVHGCEAFLPEMLARGRGGILNVASAAGLVSAPSLSPYNVTKSAVVALSETLYAEARPRGVRVTVSCPTSFRTGILQAARGPGSGNRERVQARMERSPIQAPDVARIALDDLEAGRLYSLPMRDGRWMWRLSRLAPGPFQRLVARLL